MWVDVYVDKNTHTHMYNMYTCTMYIHGYCIYTCTVCTFVSWFGERSEKGVHTSALKAQVTDVCTVHQTGFIVGVNCMKTRQEISKLISIAYNKLYWTMRIFAV